MDISLLKQQESGTKIPEPISTSNESSTVVKMGEVVTVPVIDHTAMEIVDTRNNEHYMLLINAKATLRMIEKEIRVGL